MKFKENILLYILLPLFTLTVCASYLRFVIKNDYVVAYEGTCDEVTETCFTGCSDDNCTEPYYFSKVQKRAVDIESECGADISDCEAASICLPKTDKNCSVTFCDVTVDGDSCEAITETVEIEADISTTTSSSTSI